MVSNDASAQGVSSECSALNGAVRWWIHISAKMSCAVPEEEIVYGSWLRCQGVPTTSVLIASIGRSVAVRECVQREEVLEMRNLFIRTTGADLQRTQWAALVARPGTAVAVAASTSLWGIDRSVSDQGPGSGGALSPCPRAGAGPAVQSERPAFIVPARSVPLPRADRGP